MPIALACHKGIGPAVSGTALVAQDNFSARYDLDRIKGTFSRPAHKLHGRRVSGATSLIVTTSPEIKFAADRMGLTRRIEDAGGIVAGGVCFYQMYAREMAEANGWQRLLTNSAKLVNIIGGYGYKPTLASMERCIDSAVAGKVL